ncbi:unnamed protein product [Cuscuta campestris]|uniref:Uncharacterized protein n=1 Tax=Cuscuta campestris TaxID=132261 RepID=A0A484N0Q2_9ASTE|nr:unnamed protein product [Cuscuta campestris]
MTTAGKSAVVVEVNKNPKDGVQPAECAFSEVSYDEFIWSDPSNISKLVASEEAELARRKFKQMVADIPSFSLGITQDGALQGSGDHHVVDVGNCSNSPFTPVLGVSNVNQELANASNEPRGCGEPGTNLHTKGGEACGQGSASAAIRRHDTSVVNKNEEGMMDNVLGEAMPFKSEVEKRNEQLKPARVIKPAESLRSPYVTRAVDLNDGLSTVEKRLGRWIFKNSSAPREEIVFKKGKFWLSIEDICSLDILKHISKKVLDAWCVILNLREKYRSNTSPLRLFAKTLDCVVNGGHEDNSLETTRLMFNDAMKSAWDDAEDSFNWGKPELVGDIDAI